MELSKALEILVKDWQDLHEEGGTDLSVGQVVARMGNFTQITPRMTPSQAADSIERDLRKIPGAFKSAETFLAQFNTAGDLLEEVDLECLISDLDFLSEG